MHTRDMDGLIYDATICISKGRLNDARKFVDDLGRAINDDKHGLDRFQEKKYRAMHDTLAYAVVSNADRIYTWSSQLLNMIELDGGIGNVLRAVGRVLAVYDQEYFSTCMQIITKSYDAEQYEEVPFE